MIGFQCSSMCSWTSIECTYCVAIMLICLNIFLIFMIGSLSIASSLFIDGMCVVALAPVTKTMSGATFHPLAMMLLTNNWYFVIFLSKVYASSMSLQYLNSMNCMVSFQCEKLFWRMIVWVANDAEYASFESDETMILTKHILGSQYLFQVHFHKDAIPFVLQSSMRIGEWMGGWDHS